MQCEEQTFLAEKNISQEAVKYMDLFPFTYKLYRAKPCKSTRAPWSVRKAAEDKTWKELPSSSYFNSLSPYSAKMSFLSQKAAQVQRSGNKGVLFFKARVIPSLNWESHHFHLSSRQRDRTDLGLLADENYMEVNCWKELSSRRIMKKLHSYSLLFLKVCISPPHFPVKNG